MVNLTKYFLSQPERILMTLGVFLVMLLIYYSSKELIIVLRNFIQARLGRPSLVRETSVHWTLLPRWSWFWMNAETLHRGKQKIEDHLNGVILSEDDKARVVQLALATRNTKRSVHIPFVVMCTCIILYLYLSSSSSSSSSNALHCRAHPTVTCYCMVPRALVRRSLRVGLPSAVAWTMPSCLEGT